jgi:Ca2+-binding RTX toxin-like protein
MGKRATIVGTSGADSITGTRRQDVIVALGGNDSVVGRGGADLVCGGAGADEVLGGAGRDRLNGGGGGDILYGQAGNDSMAGANGHDLLVGMGGDDRYVGNDGVDLAVFLLAPGPVEVDLFLGESFGEGSDVLTGVEGVVGSDFDDAIFGDENPNVMAGALGDDYIDGAGGTDLVFYLLSQSAVTVDLQDAYATGGEGIDVFSAVEDVLGSDFDDVLSGTGSADYLNGADGVDTIDGRGGDDICVGESLVNCPGPQVLPEEPQTGDAPPPPPGQVALDHEPAVRSDFRKAPLAAELKDLDQVVGQAVRWDSVGSHTCWGGTPRVWGPIVGSSGFAAWRPIYVWQPAGAPVALEYGQWRWAYRDSVWRIYETRIASNLQIPGTTYVGSFFVYNQVYDYDTQTTSGAWSRWWEMNPVTNQFYDTGLAGCSHEGGYS